MFDNLTDKLHGAFRSLTGNDKLTAENIEEAIREVRKSLLEADVSLKVVKIFISNVRQKALGADVLTAVRPDQQFVKIVHDELVTILGGELYVELVRMCAPRSATVQDPLKGFTQGMRLQWFRLQRELASKETP